MTKPSRKPARGRSLSVLAMALFLFLVPASPVMGQDLPGMEWDGHLKIYTRALFPGSGSAYEATGLSPNLDSTGELRLNNKTFFSDTTYVEVNYEAVAGGGGTRRDGEKLKDLFPSLFPNGLFSPPRDDRRFFDLTTTLHQDRDSFVFHRLDRAMVSLSPSWGEIRLGRQAVTWGHGFTFNPMDLFNPFAPTDLERDYKTGDDLILVQFPAKGTDIELIYVTRRDPATGDAGLDENSLGAKLHFFLGDMEAELMAARHYRDMVTGIGGVGYLGGAAWRWDLTSTFLEEPSQGRSFYLSSVVNLDYSWVWLNRNWYGYVELYYNGISRGNYTDMLSDPAVSDRLDRGELFALGRWIASANLNLEIHPLVNAYITPVVNLEDGSGMLLPRMVYDWSANVRITLTAALNWGGRGSEYGGVAIPGTDVYTVPSDTISAWVTWYF